MAQDTDGPKTFSFSAEFDYPPLPRQWGKGRY